MEKTDTAICLKKKTKTKIKEYQKNYRDFKKSQYNNEYNSFLIMILVVYAINLVIYII